ncbi:nucleoside-diphosphate-sugar epimerase [Spirochaetia bacterium]|nr:nucleoside-diphosphate-sugar epimerase [Spirochaetia bacterium]
MSKYTTILITGGAGFIGSSIALALLNAGHTVTVLDNLSTQIHGKNPELSYLYSRIKDRVRFIHGDVTSRIDWEKALINQDAVIHLAAETGTGQSMYEVEKYTRVNIGGTALLLDILANKNTSVKKIIIASSRAIYGEGKYHCAEHGDVYPNERTKTNILSGVYECVCPFCGKPVEIKPTDESSKIHPASIYGITKQVQEQMALLFCKSINLPVVIYRYQNVYGPGQSLKNPYTGILSIFSTNLIHHQPIHIFEDGKETRDFVYIADVVAATILGIENDDANYEIFNVGSGVGTTVVEVATLLKKLYRSQSVVTVTGNFRVGDIRHNFADISKAYTVLGFEPKYHFAKGIKLFAEWVQTEKIEKGNSYQLSLSEMKNRGLYA